MAIADTAAGLEDIELTHIHQYAYKRWYTPLPSLHVRATPTPTPFSPLTPP